MLIRSTVWSLINLSYNLLITIQGRYICICLCRQCIAAYICKCDFLELTFNVDQRSATGDSQNLWPTKLSVWFFVSSLSSATTPTAITKSSSNTSRAHNHMWYMDVVLCVWRWRMTKRECPWCWATVCLAYMAHIELRARYANVTPFELSVSYTMTSF